MQSIDNQSIYSHYQRCLLNAISAPASKVEPVGGELQLKLQPVGKKAVHGEILFKLQLAVEKGLGNITSTYTARYQHQPGNHHPL